MRCAYRPHMGIHGFPVACPRRNPAADGIYVPLNCNVEPVSPANLLAMLTQAISSNEDPPFAASCLKLKSGKGQLEKDQVILKKTITRLELQSCCSCTEVSNGYVALHLLKELKSERAQRVCGVHEVVWALPGLQSVNAAFSYSYVVGWLPTIDAQRSSKLARCRSSEERGGHGIPSAICVNILATCRNAAT